MKDIDLYTKELTDLVYQKISQDICERTATDLVNKIIHHSIDNNLFKFHKYYVKISTDKDAFSTEKFFSDFKRQYALQGISNKCLDKFEEAKPEILRLIEDDKLSELYLKFFAKVEIQKEGSDPIIKSLGSFFTKLVHTFNPSEYCALDNPIKEYFGFKNESFFISFLIISDAYRKWAVSNIKLLYSIRGLVSERDEHDQLQISKLTDLKLLDLIFWTKANPKKQQD